MLREYEKIFGGRHKTFSQNKIDSRKKEIIIIREIEMMCVCGGGRVCVWACQNKTDYEKALSKRRQYGRIYKITICNSKTFFFPFQIWNGAYNHFIHLSFFFVVVNSIFLFVCFCQYLFFPVLISTFSFTTRTFHFRSWCRRRNKISFCMAISVKWSRE